MLVDVFRLVESHGCLLVVQAGEVDSRCCRLVYVGTHEAVGIVAGIIVECIEFRVAIVAGSTIYAVSHIAVLMGSYLGRIEGWKLLQ